MSERIDKYVRDYLDRYQAYQKYWNYEDGCLLMGVKRMYEATGDPSYKEYILSYLQKGYWRTEAFLPIKRTMIIWMT